MLSTTDRDTATLLRERLVAAGIPVSRLLVYGSRARGTAGPDSDMDVCLVLGSVDETIRRRVSDLAWEVGFERGGIITTVEYTADQMTRSPLRSSPFIRAIEAEGVAA